MSFKSDIDAILNEFADVVDMLQVSISEYLDTFNTEKDTYRDSELLKEKMIDSLNKAVFVSELDSDDNNGTIVDYEEIGGGANE